MRLTWNIYLLIVSIVAALLAGLLLLVFVRPAASRVTRGLIIDKTYEPARTLTRRNAGPRREEWGKSERKLPAGYLLTIRLEDGGQLRYFLEETAAARFQTGESVAVTYDVRGIPGVWSKRYVSAIATISR